MSKQRSGGTQEEASDGRRSAGRRRRAAAAAPGERRVRRPTLAGGTPRPGFRSDRSGPGRWARARWGLLTALVAALLAAGGWAVARRGRGAAPARVASPDAGAAPSLSPTEAALRAAVARLPEDPDARLGLARYLLEQHRPAEAIWQFRYALDRRPDDGDATAGLARALTQIGVPGQARALLRARLAAAAADAEAHRALAEVALATARPEEALAALAGAASADPPAELLRGDAHFAAGDMAAAKAAYQRAVELEPERAAGYDRLGRLALTASAWKAAQAAYTAAREREPGNAGYSYRLGQALWAAGDRQQAQQLWEALAAAVPGYAPVRRALGQAARERKEWDEAAAHLVAAVASDPAVKEAQFALAAVMEAQGHPASACYQRGFYYLETDRPDRALPEFRRMMALAPERVDGPLMASLAYIKMQRLDLAAAEAQRGLAKHPDDPQLLARLGLLYTINHNRPLARQICQAWLQRDPKAADAAALLGRIAREDNRLPDALRFGEQAVALDPQNGAHCYELAKTLAALSGSANARRALEMARRATVLAPGEGDHWYELGLLLRGAGRPEEAADALSRALARNTGSLPSCSLLVQIAAQEHRPASARFFAALVTALEARGRVSDALWRAVYTHPADAAARERLARHLIDTGDLLHARYQLEQLAALRPADREAGREMAVVRRLLELRSE